MAKRVNHQALRDLAHEISYLADAHFGYALMGHGDKRHHPHLPSVRQTATLLGEWANRIERLAEGGDDGE